MTGRKFEYVEAQSLAEINTFAAEGWIVVPFDYKLHGSRVLMQRLVVEA